MNAAARDPMLEKLEIAAVKVWQTLAALARRVARGISAFLGMVWFFVRPPLVFAIQVLAALVVLFEEWGWKPLSEALARLARFKPWAALENWIAGLPPYGALAIFALPTAVLLPLKFAAVWLLANGMLWSAGALFLGAKVASTALVARIFMLTRPALMQIGWFARAYNWFVPWKDAIFATIRASFAWRYGRMVKTRIKLEAKQAWTRWKPRIALFWAEWKPLLEKHTDAVRAWLRGWRSELGPRLRRAAGRLRDRLRGLSA